MKKKKNYILWKILKGCFMFIWTEKQHSKSYNIIIIAHCAISHMETQDFNTVLDKILQKAWTWKPYYRGGKSLYA